MELPIVTVRDQGLFARFTGQILQILPLSFVLDAANANALSSDAEDLQRISDEVQEGWRQMAGAVESARDAARGLRQEVETRYPMMLEAVSLTTDVRQGSDEWVQRNGGPYELGISGFDTMSRVLSSADPDQGTPKIRLAARDREREDLYCGIASALVFGGALTLNPFIFGFGLGFGFAVHCR
jgi:hypothetical protein